MKKERKCKNCGKTHTNKSFCSRSCRNKFHPNIKNHHPVYNKTPPGVIILNDENLKKYDIYKTKNGRYRSLVIKKSYKLITCNTCGNKFLGLGKILGKERQYCSAKCSATNDKTKELRKGTCLKKYGEEFIAKVESVRKKYRDTCIERYGVTNISMLENIKRKKVETHRNNYGVDYPFQNEHFYKKMMKSVKEKYNVDVENVSQIPEIREKVKNTCMKRYGVPNALQLGKPCTTSKPEIEIQKFLKVNDISFLPNDKTQIRNPLTDYMLELDIWIPSMKKAIEFNGVYWHSSEQVKIRDKVKLNECKRKGIDLMVIDEEEWIKNKDKCFNIIGNFINK